MSGINSCTSGIRLTIALGSWLTEEGNGENKRGRERRGENERNQLVEEAERVWKICIFFLKSWIKCCYEIYSIIKLNRPMRRTHCSSSWANTYWYSVYIYIYKSTISTTHFAFRPSYNKVLVVFFRDPGQCWLETDVWYWDFLAAPSFCKDLVAPHPRGLCWSIGELDSSELPSCMAYLGQVFSLLKVSIWQDVTVLKLIMKTVTSS